MIIFGVRLWPYPFSLLPPSALCSTWFVARLKWGPAGSTGERPHFWFTHAVKSQRQLAAQPQTTEGPGSRPITVTTVFTWRGSIWIGGLRPARRLRNAPPHPCLAPSGSVVVSESPVARGLELSSNCFRPSPDWRTARDSPGRSRGEEGRFREAAMKTR